jgi:RNA polymerase sigma-70 factor (ECF subfamily)
VDAVSPVIVRAVRHTMRRSETLGFDVDDVVQEVFVRLYKEDRRLLKTFDAERASLNTWLSLVARSVTLDHLRQLKRLEAVLVGAKEVADAPQEEPHSEGRRVPLHLLTERQRHVIRLLFDEDMSVPDAAAALSVSEQTIRSSKHKAMLRLREFMGGD